MPLWTVMLIDRQLLINILNAMVIAQLRRIVELRVGTRVETLFVTCACPRKTSILSIYEIPHNQSNWVLIKSFRYWF